MNTRASVTINTLADRDQIARWARNVEPGTVVTFRKKSRSTDQSAKMWAMLHEVSEQVEWYGTKLDAEDWKDVFTASLRHARVVPGIDKGTFVPLGMRTSTMTIDEMSQLIELIYAFGAEQGVVFKEPRESNDNASTDSQPTPYGEPQKFYDEVVLSYDGDECLIWPYACNSHGYGHMNQQGKKTLISRLLCEATYGPPPTEEHQAAHSCGRGHEACVTKRHLSWKTRLENKADELIHGTRNRGERCGGAKLSEAAVREILSLKGKEPQKSLSERFGVSHQTISDIMLGKQWSWISEENPRPADDAASATAASNEGDGTTAQQPSPSNPLPAELRQHLMDFARNASKIVEDTSLNDDGKTKTIEKMVLNYQDVIDQADWGKISAITVPLRAVFAGKRTMKEARKFIAGDLLDCSVEEIGG